MAYLTYTQEQGTDIMLMKVLLQNGSHYLQRKRPMSKPRTMVNPKIK